MRYSYLIPILTIIILLQMKNTMAAGDFALTNWWRAREWDAIREAMIDQLKLERNILGDAQVVVDEMIYQTEKLTATLATEGADFDAAQDQHLDDEIWDLDERAPWHDYEKEASLSQMQETLQQDTSRNLELSMFVAAQAQDRANHDAATARRVKTSRVATRHVLRLDHISRQKQINDARYESTKKIYKIIDEMFV
jgi:hypothetical protein